jgi:indolepyruvate ferredoxin oxidoreductase beta subunit
MSTATENGPRSPDAIRPPGDVSVETEATASDPPLRKRIFVAGVGGQGSITATLVIGEAALAAGLNAVASEIHGMAQRGGVVQTAVLVGDVHSAMIPDHSADVLLGFEPVEALRFAAKASPERTAIVVNRHPIVPVGVSLGWDRYPALDEVERALSRAGRQLYLLDAVGLAARAGTPKAVGAVMVGALAGLGELPLERTHWLGALLERVPPRYREANEQAFDAGFAATATATATATASASATTTPPPPTTTTP